MMSKRTGIFGIAFGVIGCATIWSILKDMKDSEECCNEDDCSCEAEKAEVVDPTLEVGI